MKNIRTALAVAGSFPWVEPTENVFSLSLEKYKVKPMSVESQMLVVSGGGNQTVIPQLAISTPQIIYLDFDGELTSYHNRDLDIHIDDVVVEDSGLTQERIASIIKALNDDFADQNVIFVTDRPTDTDFSTIYVGKTSSFGEYGNFAGLAETVDIDNQNKNDNAFVMLDDTADDSAIIETISHEARHLIGTLEHGGDGIGRYAEDAEDDGYIYYYYLNNQTFTGELTHFLSLSRESTGKTIAYSSYRSNGGDISSCIGTNYVSANNAIINSGDKMYVSCNGIASATTINSNGWMFVSSGGTATVTTVNSGGSITVAWRGTASATTVNGQMIVYSGGTVSATAVNSGGNMCVSSGGTAYGINISSGGRLEVVVAPETYVEGSIEDSAFEIKSAFISEFTTKPSCYLYVSSGGTANNTTVDSSGMMFVFSGGMANSTTVNSAGSGFWVREGGIANNTIISGSYMLVYSNGTANNTTACADLHIYPTGIMNYTTLISSGRLQVLSGGTANYTVINSGWMRVYSGGTAFNIKNQDTIECDLIGNDSNTIVKGNNADGKEFYIIDGVARNISGGLEISSGGTAYDTTVISDGWLFVSSGGTANYTTVSSGGYFNVSSGGIVNYTTINSCWVATICSGGIANHTIINSGSMTMLSGAKHSGTLQIASRARVETEQGSIIDFTLIDRSIDDDYLINNINRIFAPRTNIGGSPTYSITVDTNQENGIYRLADNASGFRNDVILIIDGTNTSRTFTWQGDKYDSISLNGKRYILDNSNGKLCLEVGDPEPIKIIDFETLKLAVSSDWQKYSAAVKLPDFKDGWGKQTNKRHWARIEVTNASIAATGTQNQIEVTMKAKMEAALGIISIAGDISGEGQGLFLTISKDEDGWNFTDWDLVGKVSATLQQVDRRKKFHLLNTTFDPMKITVSADINTRKDIYTIQWDYKKSGYGIFQMMTLKATLISVPVTSGSEQYEFDMSSISLTLADDSERVRFNPGMHIYEINLTGKNLAKTDEEAPKFSGSIGFTWMSTTLRVGSYKWQRELLDSAGIQYAAGGEVKFSIIDTKLSLSMSLNGDFSTGGDVSILCAGGKALANISGTVTYTANKERLTILGTMDLAGMMDLSAKVISVKGNLRAEAEGTIIIPSWAKWLSGYSLAKGKAIIVSNSETTVISIWGELYQTNGTYSIKGYSYDLITGDAKDISNTKHIDDVYIDSGDVLEIGNKATATCQITEEDASQMSKVIVQGSYANASDYLTILICNETTDESYQFLIGAERTFFHNGKTRSLDDKSECDVNVAILDKHGFSIEFNAFSAGTWTVEVQDNGATLTDFDLWLEYESSNMCRVESFAITKVSSYTVDFSYSITGGNDNTVAELYCRNLSDVDSESVSFFLNSLTVGENQSYTWTQSSIMADGEYEFFLRVSGDFIPYESNFVGGFIIDNKKVSNDIQIIEEVVDDGNATNLHPILSAQFERFEISNDNENWLEVGNDYVLTTDSAIEFYVKGYDADSEAYGDVEKISLECPVELTGEDGFAWSSTVDNARFRVKLTSETGDVFIETSNTALSVSSNKAEQLQGRVQIKGTGVWTSEYTMDVSPESEGLSVLSAANDGSMDVFMTTINGKWSDNYQALHTGVGAWSGTNEIVELDGKNQILDVFAGSDDASILLMTDDENGDALFIDDIYSAFPEGLNAQARIAKIDEIRAGAGDDIIDLTSQRFDYVGRGMTVKGGLGDDIIWANNGDNTLFGDAGNDRIVGAGGNDVIVGGAGDDSMHGGGGEDIFAFGGAWGNDNVEQLTDGMVTLWFENGSLENWNEATLTYKDGENSVNVSSVSAENVTLKFGDDGSQQYSKLLEAGAFDEFSSERIFENKNTRGMLA